MARIILVQEVDYELQYQESMNYLNGKYHNQPSRLKNLPLTEAQQLLLATHRDYNNCNPRSQHRTRPESMRVI